MALLVFTKYDRQHNRRSCQLHGNMLGSETCMGTRQHTRGLTWGTLLPSLNQRDLGSAGSSA